MTAVYPARLCRAATCLVALTSLTFGTSLAFAQAQPAPQVPAPKATPRPVAPKQQPKQQQQQQPAQQAPAPADQQQQQQAAGEQPPVVYSPWTKFCGKDNNNPQAKEVCLTVKEARLETSQFLAGAALIEQTCQEKKLFRPTIPNRMQMP